MKKSLQILARDQALIVDLIETGVVMLVAFGISLSTDQETWLVAVLVGVAGLAKAFLTKPFPVTAITDVGRAVLMLAASFGLNLPPDRVAVAVTFIGTLTTLIARGQITPNSDPVTSSVGAGSGPVRGEAGYADSAYIALIGVGMLVSAPNLFLMAATVALCLLTLFVVQRRKRAGLMQPPRSKG